jgi:predicted transcriptional regulator
MKRQNVIRVGIASYEQQKARLMAIALGEHNPKPDEPKIWFSSMESFAQVLSSKNQLLLEIIAVSKPTSIGELSQLTGRRPPNLSRSLSTLERYGLVSLEKKGKAVVPRTVYDRVEVNLDLIGGTHWKSERRMA